MILKWFLSGTVREAVQMYRHVRRLLQAQRDLLSPQAIEAVAGAITSLRAQARSGADQATLREGMAHLEQTANKWLLAPANAGLRENLEVLLVAIAVAMAIRTFFLQPFKIPTGSMQPTLYGITHEDLRGTDIPIPNPVIRFVDFWIHGVSYVRVTALADGVLRIEEPIRLVLFNLRQNLLIGGVSHPIWFPPDNLAQHLGMVAGREFKAGEEVLRLRFKSGDHLFVDRMTYNFRRPTRGDIIVFQTEGIHVDERLGGQDVPQDQFYIKRLVALGGERVKIGRDQHLVINGDRLTSATPHFENVYNFKPDAKANEYFGHVGLGLFGDEREVQVRPKHYLAMGDNTRNSLDSRYWGDFPEQNVIGRYWFVYWPITDRFGWAPR